MLRALTSAATSEASGVKGKYWEEYFAAARHLGHCWEAEAKAFAPLIAHLRDRGIFRVLDLGCGAGDLCSLLRHSGLQVVGLDLAGSALRIARERFPHLKFVQADLANGFPFRSGTFDAVVACLSIHYFHWSTTVALIREIRRMLRGGGLFFLRVNSTTDHAHGAGQGRQIETDLYECEGRLKRFFHEADCRLLLQDFTIELLEHRRIPHLDCVEGRWAIRQKAVWDGLAQKGGSPHA